jgi:1,4-dihydroxy-2-naphthoyl-CoA synthase
VGFGKASDLFLSGRLIGADEAYRIGLADRLAEPDQLLRTALDVAESYAANPDPQLRMTKQLITMNASENDLVLIQRREQEALAECWRSPEHAEAVNAFMAKRPPVFRPAAMSTPEAAQ